MGAFLKAGSFYSQVAARDRRCGFVMSELEQPAPRQIPYHEHELPYFTLVISGYYNEGDRLGTREFYPLTAMFNPRECSHWSAVGNTGARLFTVEIPKEQWEDSGVKMPDAPVADLGVGHLIWKALRLFREFRCGDAMEPLTAESLTCEMIAAAGTGRAAEDRAPKWWTRAEEYLRANAEQPLRIREVAKAADVHPVHLARVFRQRTGITPGEYVQSLRVQKACARLSTRERPLADVAIECGFTDQSHMTKLFRRFTGTTPAEFRAGFAKRSSQPTKAQRAQSFHKDF